MRVEITITGDERRILNETLEARRQNPHAEKMEAEIAAEAAFMRALQEVLALANRMASDEGVGMEPATTISASMSAQLTSVGQPETA